METLVPKDRGEEIAVFRSLVIGTLTQRAMTRGELHRALVELSRQHFRPPGSQVTRRLSVPTLERWYYRFRKGGLDALRPRPRKDAGRAKALGDVEKQLVCDTRREHPGASAELILKTLESRGAIAKGVVSASTVRRLLAQHGLDRVTLRASTDGGDRRRWVAPHPGALWHGDVCHGPTLRDGTRLRIHALLDDCSRFVVVLEARSSETEDDMLGLFVSALRRWGAPDALYLDNGSTYSGLTLATACARLGVSLIHAKPYDPQARGKMERFWRTLREALLDHLDLGLSLAEVQARLDAFLDRHYHSRPHSSLLGDTPRFNWAYKRTRLVSEEDLVKALTVRARRRVSGDGVVSIDGLKFEVRHRLLAGHTVLVASCLVEGLTPSVHVEYDGRTYPLHPLDAKANALVKRAAPSTSPSSEKPVKPLDPFKPDSES